ncbi:MAG TPA: carbohydrate kinase family protein [Mycobacteriales bacterium]|nr:carbohydrate kinase family protein [Mycobacteriales bacterium]
MRIAVTGSIATDYLMTFQGKFADQLLPGELHRLSLSFLADDLDRRRGGVAANIAYGMAQLGLTPLLVGAVGADWTDYQAWLDRAGVDTTGVHVSELKHTARFFCTTDLDQCQIATFYPGAMSEAREIELAPIAARSGGLDLVVVSPNDPEAMLRHTAEAKASGIPFVADPSQQLSSLDGPGIGKLVDGATYLITNDYEAALIQSKTGWTEADVLDRVETRVTTLGSSGCVITSKGEAPIEVPVVPEERKADPTGVGDAFRAGFLAARSWPLGLERSAQVGTLLATYVLETVGTQEYAVSAEPFLARLASAYGDDAAAEVAPHLPS